MDASTIIKQFELDQSTWTFKGFHGVLHTFFPVGDCINLYRYGNDGISKTIFFVKDNYISWYWDDSDQRRLREKFVADAQKNPKILDEQLKDWQKHAKKFDQVMEKIDKLDLSSLLDKELLQWYDTFHDAYVQEYSRCVVLQDGYSMYSGEFLEPAFKKFFETKKESKKFQEYYNLLMSPTKDSFVNEELKGRYYIQEKIEKNLPLKKAFEQSSTAALNALTQFPSIEKEIEAHAKKYFFVKNNYAIQLRIGKEYIAELLCGLVKEGKKPVHEIEKMEKQLSTNKRGKAKLIRQFSIPLELQTLIQITELFTYMQDTRKKYMMMASRYQRDFFEEVGKRLKIPKEEMEYTIYPELREMLLENKIDRKKLQLRKKHCVCIQDKKGWHVYEGKIVDELFEKAFAVKQEMTEIKGLIASSGKAIGPVRIIYKIHDFINMQEGDVLVTSMTRPEFVPIMKKAVAIVTDEGGITSHAAIVSRELHKPCIIGTKVATKVLKNGQRVEVDANKGIVRILALH